MALKITFMSFRKSARLTILPLFAFFPAVVSAAPPPATLREAAVLFLKLLQSLFALLFVLLVVGMLWGVVLFFANSDNEKKRIEIKGYLFWAIIGITVVFALWGILNILTQTVGWGEAGIPIISVPGTPTPPGS